MRAMLFAFMAITSAATAAAGQDIPPQVAAAQKYILDKDYPEVFGDARYKTKVQHVVIADLDGDGQAEVIFHYMPHYRQSPPIVIYRVSSDMSVTRVKEGLAPGPLVPLTGDYLDSHTLGEAVDLDLGAQQSDAAVRRKFAESALQDFGSVVEYAKFFHMDHRAGTGTYIDMTGVANPPQSKTCEDFEFAPVRQISAGTVSAIAGGNLLAAWTEGKVYLYRIKAFLPSGLLDKERWVVTPAADFGGFAPGAAGPLRYTTASGSEKAFAVQCREHTCTQVQ